jgi:uncharacterized protein (TIGR03437 family)
MVWSGWQADVKKLNPLRHTMAVPTASENGKEITGWVWLSVEVTQPAPSTLFWTANRDFYMYEPVDLNAPDSELTRQTGPDDPAVKIPREDWAFARCDAAHPFPGVPSFESLCLKAGLEPRYAYSVRYRAKNPAVMGLGLAAIRDLVSFLRNDSQDSFGTPNPVGGAIKASIMQGQSQSGQLVRTFLQLGFNLDEQGRRVFEGMNPVGAGTRTALNVRFSLPTPGQAFRLGHLRPGWESPFTWMPENDTVAGRFGWLLERCMQTASCPNIIDVVSSSEYWNQRASLTLTDASGQFDAWIPRNVRMYFVAGTQHSPAPSAPSENICQQPTNPNDWSAYERALMVALEQWVLENKEPPPSQIPRLAEGTLVQPDAPQIGWPKIPGVNYTGRINALPLVDFGPAFNAKDMTGILADNPVVIPDKKYAVLVPKVDADGNEVAGLRPAAMQVPIATYTGWNLQRAGFAEGELCQNTGAYIPFRRSRAERDAVGDPRLSLEERYGNHAGYVEAVRQAANRLVAQRNLLPDDAKAIIEGAEKSDVLQPVFFRKDIPVPERPVMVAAGDFNGDGRSDLAVVTMDGVYTLLNAGAGNFGRPIRTDGVAATDLAGEFVRAADFNGDGKDDLAGDRVLLLSRGDGTFTVARRDLAHVVGIGDFNGDGKPDLLQADDNGVLRVLLGNGDGTFRTGATLTTPHTEPQVIVPVVTDFNLDGRSDVGVVSFSPPPDGAAFRVFLGKGDGTFGAEIRTQLACGPGCPARTADFNGDGVPDLVSQAGVALGRGDGTFQSPIPFSSYLNPLFIAAADVTGDGRVDMVTGGGPTGPAISIYQGRGDGTLSPPVTQAAGFSAYPGIAADLDGDGRLDLAIVNSDSNTLSILFSRAQGGAPVARAVSAAGGTAIVAPESLATLLVTTPATASTSAGTLPWTPSLGGISLEVRDSTGAARLAPLLYVSPTQVNFQVPSGTATGEATLAIVSAGRTTQVGSMQVDTVAPGLFLVSSAIPAATGMLVDPGGDQTPLPVFKCSPSASGVSCDLSPIPLSTAGARSVYLTFLGTGFGGANQDKVTCSVNGMQVPVTSAGSQGPPGQDQITIHLLPDLLKTEWFEGMPVTIRINGVAANSVWIDVK